MTTPAEQDWLLSSCAGSVREFFAELGVVLPDRSGGEVSARCFANPGGHRRDDRSPSCSVNMLTGLWHCKGCGRAGNPYQAALALGRDERQARELAQRYGLFLERVRRERPRLPTERRVEIWREALHASERLVVRLGEVKAWTVRAMVRCELGWDGERVTIPIRNATSKLVGLVRYLPGGQPKTLALPGSRRELFPAPESLSYRRPVFVVEGEPDAVSVWSMGHQAVGIPGAGGWKLEWTQRLAGHRLIMLPDCDRQGRALAQRVSQSVPNVRVVDIEPGREDGYDVGDKAREAAAEGGLRQLSAVLDRLAA